MQTEALTKTIAVIGNQTTKNDFYDEIQNFINGKMSYNGKTGMIAAIPYTQNKYNCSKVEVCYKIDKCLYFSKNPNANLLTWKAHCINQTNKLFLL